MKSILSLPAGALWLIAMATVIATCDFVHGHAGPRIYFDIHNGRVVAYNGPYPEPINASGGVSTNSADYAANYKISTVFPGLPPYETQQGGSPTAGILPLGWDDNPLNFQTEFPGLQVFGASSVPNGAVFSFDIAGEVQWFDFESQTFEKISKAFPLMTPFIAVNNDAGQLVFSSTGFFQGYSAFAFNGDLTDHQHLTYTICTPEDLADGFDPEDAPAGIYALPLQFTCSDASLPSVTFWLLFGDTGPEGEIDQSTMQTQMLNAIAVANQTLAAVSVTSVVVNANNTALAGSQRSMVDSIVYTFNQPVSLAANAFTIGVHSGQTGTIPTLNWSSPDNGTTWIVTFSGNGVVGTSIGDGVYDIILDGTKVTSTVNSDAGVISRPTDTFYRLFGDNTGNMRVTGADYAAFLNTNGLRSGATGFNPAFDYNNDGRINGADYGAFLTNNGKRVSGFTPSI